MSAFILKVRAFIGSWPEPLRLIVRDILEGAIAAIGAVILVMPTNVSEAKDQAVVIAVAAIGAAVAVARRELLPYLTRWLLGLFTTPTDTTGPSEMWFDNIPHAPTGPIGSTGPGPDYRYGATGPFTSGTGPGPA